MVSGFMDYTGDNRAWTRSTVNVPISHSQRTLPTLRRGTFYSPTHDIPPVSVRFLRLSTCVLPNCRTFLARYPFQFASSSSRPDAPVLKPPSSRLLATIAPGDLITGDCLLGTDHLLAAPPCTLEQRRATLPPGAARSTLLQRIVAYTSYGSAFPTFHLLTARHYGTVHFQHSATFRAFVAGLYNTYYAFTHGDVSSRTEF